MSKFGLGLDVGTTSVQARLVNLDTGGIIDEIYALNTQRPFGADVMSRIGAAREGKTGDLFAAINNQTEGILRHFIDKYRLSKIEKCNVSGNTTMMHLFCGVNPGAMGEAPYTPEFLEERYFSGKELNLSADKILLLPGISAFVGADIIAGLVFSSIFEKNESCFFTDIGTNGEVAVWNKNGKKLFCSSTAAGPCFEGAEISRGMIAQAGAINRISLSKDSLNQNSSNQDSSNQNSSNQNSSANWFTYNLTALPNNRQKTLYYTTVENEKARGICGAGLIDAIALMKKLGVIEESGAFADNYAQTDFPVADGIGINQKDVRLFQLAKSAIYSGITVLCKAAGLTPSALDKAYIAGGLGFYINLENAADTGLLPREIIRKAEVSGNTSLKGAVQSLTDETFLPRCREIIAASTVIDLGIDKEFSDAFADNMII